MIRLLTWLWAQVKHLAGLVAGLASSVLTWIAAGVAAFFSWANSLLEGALDQAFSWLGANVLQPLDFGSDAGGDLVGYLAHFFALADLAQVGLDLAAIWVAARLARLAMVPIRAALELL